MPDHVLVTLWKATLGLSLGFVPCLRAEVQPGSDLPVVRLPLICQSQEEAHQARISILQFFDQDRKLITVDYDAVAKVWEIPSGKLMLLFSVRGSAENGVVSPSGELFASEGGAAQVVDLGTGKKLWDFESPTGVVDVDFHPKRDEILISDDTTMKVLEARTGRFLRELDRAAAKPQWRLQVHFVSDSRFVTVSQKGVVMEWDYDKGIPIRTIAQGFLPDLVSQTLFVASEQAVVIHIGGLRPAYKVSVGDGTVSTYDNLPSQSLSLAQDASAIHDAIVFMPYIYGLKSCKLRERWEFGAWDDLGPVRFSPTGKYFATTNVFSWKIFELPKRSVPESAR